MIRGLDFISVPTRTLGPTLDFYEKTLGLPVTMRADTFAEVDLAGVTLSINQPEAWGGTFAPLPHSAIALHVDDMDATLATLRGAGVQVSDPVDTGVCKMAFFQDPAGNGLTIHHRYAPEGH